MKLLRSERPRIIFWKSLPISGSKMWYRFDVSWKTVVFIVQSGLKLYNFSIVAARIETSTKRSGSRKECGKTTIHQTTWKAIIQLILHYILFYLNICRDLLEHRATSSAGKTVLVCLLHGLYSREKCRPFCMVVGAFLILILVVNHRHVWNVWHLLLNGSHQLYCVLFCVMCWYFGVKFSV